MATKVKLEITLKKEVWEKLHELSVKTEKNPESVITNAIINEHYLMLERDAMAAKPDLKIRVYISIHSSIPKEFLNKIKDYFINNDFCTVDFYTKGEEWDSYRIKNAELFVTVPLINDEGQYILGNGTQRELEIALKHDRTVIIANYDSNKFYRYKGTRSIPVPSEEKRNWLKTAVIETNEEFTHDFITEVHQQLILEGRVNYDKNIEKI